MLTAKQSQYLDRLFDENEHIDATTKCEVAVTLGLAEEKVCMYVCVNALIPSLVSYIAPSLTLSSPLPRSHHRPSLPRSHPRPSLRRSHPRPSLPHPGFGGAAFTASRQLAIEPGLKLAVTLHHLYITIVTVCRMSCKLTKLNHSDYCVFGQ